MTAWNDYNDARQNPNLIPKGTLAKVHLSIRPGGFDDPSQGWTGGLATRSSSGAVYLNGEFTVLEGPYHPALFTAINKDTAELHHELVPFDAALAQRMSDRAVRVLRACDAGDLLPRVALSRDHQECRQCAWAQRCWGLPG